jgi:hypothetical protein
VRGRAVLRLPRSVSASSHRRTIRAIIHGIQELRSTGIKLGAKEGRSPLVTAARAIKLARPRHPSARRRPEKSSLRRRPGSGQVGFPRDCGGPHEARPTPEAPIEARGRPRELARGSARWGGRLGCIAKVVLSSRARSSEAAAGSDARAARPEAVPALSRLQVRAAQVHRGSPERRSWTPGPRVPGPRTRTRGRATFPRRRVTTGLTDAAPEIFRI